MRGSVQPRAGSSLTQRHSRRHGHLGCVCGEGASCHRAVGVEVGAVEGGEEGEDLFAGLFGQCPPSDVAGVEAFRRSAFSGRDLMGVEGDVVVGDRLALPRAGGCGRCCGGWEGNSSAAASNRRSTGQPCCMRRCCSAVGGKRRLFGAALPFGLTYSAAWSVALATKNSMATFASLAVRVLRATGP